MHHTPAALAHIAAPADADHVEDWVDESDLGMPVRWFRGTARTVAGVRVVINGWQEWDGPTARHISVHAVDAELDAVTARELAAALLAAADELDQLAG